LTLSRRHFCGLLGATSALGFCGGCAVNPATGKQDMILVGSGQEKSIGLREHPKILSQFGGAYDDHRLSGYVASIGGRLAAATETPGLGFTFTLLNSPVVNAFALPGGYIYITRGLMALAQDEAELAGVLGHEIGHVVARHSAQRMSQTLLAQLGVGLLGAVAGGPSSQLAGGVAGLYLKSYSRDQEFEADTLGVRYMNRVGYDADAMASFLQGLRANTKLEAKIEGRPPGETDAFDIGATHPRTLERVQRAVASARAAAPRRGGRQRGKDAYLDSINGMLFGDGPEQGYILGRRFAHPTQRFDFTVPQGFKLRNSPNRIVASSARDNAKILFDAAPKPYRGAMTSYLANVWARGARLRQVEAIKINGFYAATGWVQGRGTLGKGGTGPLIFRLVAIRFDARTVFRFLFAASPSAMPSVATAFQRVTYSFRRLTPAQVAELKPRRIRVAVVGDGDTAARFSQRMAVDSFQRERFDVLNGLFDGARLIPGGRVKLVVRKR
jgi:predicted Zn-dependent protease